MKILILKTVFFCLSRPRRFGKSVTAQMLCSYYARGIDSSPLFDELKIASFGDYKKHLNQYDVIFVRELKEAYPNSEISTLEFLDLALQDVYN